MIPVPIGIRPGSAAAVVAPVVAGGAAGLAVVSAGERGVIVFQFSLIAIGLLVGAVLVGSERGVATASLPFLLGAGLGLDRQGAAIGRALIVGLLWYGASELAWLSIEQRGEAEPNPAVGRQRTREVTTVIVVATATGLTAALAADAAPTRTLLVKGLVVAGVLSGLVAAARSLARRPDGAGRADPTL